MKKIVAATAVLRLRKLAEPLEPNRLPAEPEPNAAPISAPLPCCISTRPISTNAATRCTTQTNVSTHRSQHYIKDKIKPRRRGKSPETRPPPGRRRRSIHHRYPASQTGR